MLWTFRYYLKNNPAALPKFLKSVNWSREPAVNEALQLLEDWAEIKYDDAIFLLSRDFSANDIYLQDSNTLMAIQKENLITIRNHAVNILHKLENKEISKKKSFFWKLSV